MIIALFLIVGFVVALAIVPLLLRSVMRQEAETDSRLHATGAETLSYVVPEGQDPVILITALHHANYEVVSDPSGGEQRLLIGCRGGRVADREAIRAVIEHVHATGIDGVELNVDHARFKDEV